jgi:hypothetical protein
MKSGFWIKSFDEIKNDPYNYESQQSFLNEALEILDEIFKKYDKYQGRFSLDERTLEKAIWMLHLDALDSLRDCIYLLKSKKHRIVGKLFRDIMETLDLATLFWEEREGESNNLTRWYENKVIAHSEFRRHLKNTRDQYISDDSKEMYKELSRWSHHCYMPLKNSYSLGGKDAKMLIYDSHSEILVLPQTLSQYIWEIKELILYFLVNIKMVGLIDWNEIKAFLNRTIQGLKFY